MGKFVKGEFWYLLGYLFGALVAIFSYSAFGGYFGSLLGSFGLALACECWGRNFYKQGGNQ